MELAVWGDRQQRLPCPLPHLPRCGRSRHAILLHLCLSGLTCVFLNPARKPHNMCEQHTGVSLSADWCHCLGSAGFALLCSSLWLGNAGPEREPVLARRPADWMGAVPVPVPGLHRPCVPQLQRAHHCGPGCHWDDSVHHPHVCGAGRREHPPPAAGQLADCRPAQRRLAGLHQRHVLVSHHRHVLLRRH